MRARHLRLLRLLRLLAACIALVVARPAPCAAEPMVRIVLVAEASRGDARDVAPADDLDVRRGRQARVASAPLPSPARPLPAVARPRSVPRFGGALPRLYLRNCALLR
jgi:hypothetical protein